MNKIYILVSDNYARMASEYGRMLAELIGREKCQVTHRWIFIPSLNLEIRFVNVRTPSAWRGLILGEDDWLVTSCGFLADDGERLIDLRWYLSGGRDVCTGEFSDFDDMIESVARMVKGRVKWRESL